MLSMSFKKLFYRCVNLHEEGGDRDIDTVSGTETKVEGTLRWSHEFFDLNVPGIVLRLPMLKSGNVILTDRMIHLSIHYTFEF